jgi:hypothetical protein
MVRCLGTVVSDAMWENPPRISGRKVTLTFDFDIDLTLGWNTLFLGDINTGTWPFRLGESQKRQ